MRLVPVKEFCEEHDASINSVYSIKNQNSEAEYIIEKNGVTYIDEEFLMNRADLQQKLWVLSHDYYYYYTYVLDITQNRLAQILEKKVGGTYASWAVYLSTLFKIRKKSILSTRVPELTLKFVMFSEYIIPKAHTYRKNDEKYLQRLKDMV